MNEKSHGVLMVAPPGAEWPARLGSHLDVYYSITVAHLTTLHGLWPVLELGGLAAVFLDVTFASASWRAEWRAFSDAVATPAMFLVGRRADHTGAHEERGLIHLPWPITTDELCAHLDDSRVACRWQRH